MYRAVVPLPNNPVGLVVPANDNRGVKLSDQVLNTNRTQELPLTSVNNVYSRVWLRNHCFTVSLHSFRVPIVII
jgi:hypothetical protein